MSNKRIETEGKVLAIATYKPKAGQDKELMQLVEKHLPALRKLGLVTGKTGYLAKSKDGTVIEVFEWVSVEAIDAAHQHPAIADIWEKMTIVADFNPMNTLPESKKPFPGFEMVN